MGEIRIVGPGKTRGYPYPVCKKIYVEPPHGLTIYQVSAQSDVNCRRSYTETKKFTDGQMDAEGYNIIRPCFKRGDNKRTGTGI